LLSLSLFFKKNASNTSNASASTSTTTTPTQSRIVPQLPSPPETLNSTSQSPTRPAQPVDEDPSSSQSSTYQRGRPESRYPTSLGPGRVPLHRRGTSKTYERLEDLLREAGYKETRVFTPETERAEAEAEEKKERELRGGGSARGGVGAVVGFLTGLMSRTPSLARDADASTKADSSSGLRRIPPLQQEYSPPPSPLAHKQQLKSSSKCTSISSHSYSPSASTPAFTSSAESLTRSPRGPSSNLGLTYSITSPNSTSDSTPRANRHVLSSSSHPHGTTRLRPPPSTPSNQMPQTYAQASKARAYLRHMASAPSIQPSSSSTRPPTVRHSSSRYVGRGGSRSGYPKGTMVLDDSDAEGEDAFMGRRGNGEGEDESDIHGRPPLPRTWLENVARAILFGGAGAHAGTPSPFSPSRSHPQSPRPRLETLQMSPAMSSKSALSDQTNVPQIVVRKDLAPPFLCAQVAARRTPSETRVSRTRVVCRSAPPSRSGSRVRGGKDVDVDVKSRAVRGTEETIGGMF
jgi:hypothetical protein